LSQKLANPAAELIIYVLKLRAAWPENLLWSAVAYYRAHLKTGIPQRRDYKPEWVVWME